MSQPADDRNAYTSWYTTTHLSQEPYRSALDRAWTDYRAAFNNGPQHVTLRLQRLAGPTIRHLTYVDSLINRWPLATRCTLAQSPQPFASWSQPAQLERRKQAAAVWYGMLGFIVFVWSMDGDERGLREVGFEPDRELIDLIDDLALYAEIQERFQPRGSVVIETVDTFFHKAVCDSQPTARTNPLLWWMGVLIHGDVVRRHDSLPTLLPGLVDSLGFRDKLAALEHYARVLVFHSTFLKWVADSAPHPLSGPGEEQTVVAQWVEGRDISWVDAGFDVEPEQDRQEPDLNAAAWQSWHEVLREAVGTWLTWDSEGPLREVHALRTQTMPLARERQNKTVLEPTDGGHRPYIIYYSVIDNWCINPGSFEPMPKRHNRTFKSRKRAEKALPGIARAKLAELMDYDDDEPKELDELADMFEDDKINDGGELFSFGDERMCVAYDEMGPSGREGQSIRCRVLFCDEANDAKVIAWAEKAGGV